MKTRKKYIQKQQHTLDSIQAWLADTTEPIDDWDYDGKELIIINGNKEVERYNKSDLRELLRDMK